MDARPKTALIVEDDPATQQLLVALMRRDGLDSIVASNGAMAIEHLANGQFGVIILDLMMPAVSGHEVINYLSRENRSDAVIVCTAAGPRMTGEINSPNVRAVVRKPFDIEQLTRAVAEVIAR